MKEKRNLTKNIALCGVLAAFIFMVAALSKIRPKFLLRSIKPGMR